MACGTNIEHFHHSSKFLDRTALGYVGDVCYEKKLEQDLKKEWHGGGKEIAV